MANDSYLKWRGDKRTGKWWFQMPVPKELHGRVVNDGERGTGKPVKNIYRALHTGDIREARRQRDMLAMKWKAVFARMREGTTLTTAELESQADAEVHRLYATVQADPLRGRSALDQNAELNWAPSYRELKIRPHAIEAIKALGVEPTDANVAQMVETMAASAFKAKAYVDMRIAPPPLPPKTGSAKGFTQYLDEYLGTRSDKSAKWNDMIRSSINKFAARFPSIKDVTRAEVRRWVTSMTNDDGLSHDRIKNVLSAVRGYWDYLQQIEVVEDSINPFDDIGIKYKKNGKAKRKSFDPTAVVNLLNAATAMDDGELADLIRMAMWSGARIEELCSLKVENVSADHFDIVDTKTQAGIRQVPIHAQLQQTVARLIGDRKDGWLFTNFTENKYGDRSNAIGKRFGRLKTESGFGPEVVFHSIRKTVITQLENAGVPESVTADIVGHEKPTMTYGLYSDGSSMAVKAAALTKLSYPDA